MSVRLLIAIFSTLLEEAALVVIALWGLPQLGIEIPLGGLITVVVVWAVAAVFIYQTGSRALKKKPIVGLPAMIGSRGKAVSPLAPGGFVRVKGELWEAKSASGSIDIGEEVTVVEQDALRLVVRKGRIEDSEMT